MREFRIGEGPGRVLPGGDPGEKEAHECRRPAEALGQKAEDERKTEGENQRRDEGKRVHVERCSEKTAGESRSGQRKIGPPFPHAPSAEKTNRLRLLA